MTVSGHPSPDEIGTGQIVCRDPNGTETVVATGFLFPSHDGGPRRRVVRVELGVAPAGLREVLKVTLP